MSDWLARPTVGGARVIIQCMLDPDVPGGAYVDEMGTPHDLLKDVNPASTRHSWYSTAVWGTSRGFEGKRRSGGRRCGRDQSGRSLGTLRRFPLPRRGGSRLCVEESRRRRSLRMHCKLRFQLAASLRDKPSLSVITWRSLRSHSGVR